MSLSTSSYLVMTALGCEQQRGSVIQPTRVGAAQKTWMAGASPAMTDWVSAREKAHR